MSAVGNPLSRSSAGYGVDIQSYGDLLRLAASQGRSTERVVRDLLAEHRVHRALETVWGTPERRPDHTSVVSMFCGCGGFDVGLMGGFEYNGLSFPRHPFQIVAAYDVEPKCIETYRLNISDHAVTADLSCVESSSLPPAEVLTGGFPCQDFATCGPRQGLSSSRGRLYLALVRYAEAHRPKVILGENVPGLENMAGGEVLRTILADIEAKGYKTKVWKLFGPDYGLPQRRTRLFIVAVRDDLRGFPVFPQASHSSEHRSIRWAIDDLRGVTDDSIPNQSQYFRASRAKRGNGQGDETSAADLPAYTVRANAKSRVQFHYELERRLTVRECARLQTFPDFFVFPHSATTNVMQIGNAVPPILGHAVASSVADWLDGV